MLHIFRQVLFWAGNQDNHQNFEKSLLTNKLWHVFMGMKQKKIFFWKKNFQNSRQKKAYFSKSPILEIFSRKFLRLVLGLVGLNDAKGIDVAQRIWPWGCPTKAQKQPKSTKNAFWGFPAKSLGNLVGNSWWSQHSTLNCHLYH